MIFPITMMHVFHTTKQFPETVYLEILSVPTGKSSGPQDFFLPPPTSQVSHKSSLSSMLLSTSYVLEVPRTSSSGSINLLEWFTELKETFDFPDSQLKEYKEHN